MLIGGGTSMISFSKSSPGNVIDGEIIVVALDEDEEDSVILKMPFTPVVVVWSVVLLVVEV